MKTLRKGVFETNSSSTHSICISKSAVPSVSGKHIHFTFGEYGWETGKEWDTASYLYTGIMGNEDYSSLERLKSKLDDLGITYDFETPKKDKWGYLECGYVDHSEDLFDLIHALLEDNDLLIRYLFGDSFIITGNDNDEFSYERSTDVDEDKYDCYFKGN